MKTIMKTRKWRWQENDNNDMKMMTRKWYWWQEKNYKDNSYAPSHCCAWKLKICIATILFDNWHNIFISTQFVYINAIALTSWMPCSTDSPDKAWLSQHDSQVSQRTVSAECSCHNPTSRQQHITNLEKTIIQDNPYIKSTKSALFLIFFWLKFFSSLHFSYLPVHYYRSSATRNSIHRANREIQNGAI